MTPSPRHTRGVERNRADGDDDLGALQLGRAERWVLDQVRRRGVAGFVVMMTGLSVGLSAVLVSLMMVSLYGADDPTFWPGLAMSIVVPALVAPPVMVFVVRLAAGLDRASHLLWDAAHTDALTGVANRRAFFDAIDQQGGTADRAVDIAVVDVDAFKSINDRYGHVGGDAALERLAGWLTEYVGPERLVARMGGDEFAVVVPAAPGADHPVRKQFDHDGIDWSVTIGWQHCRAGDSLEEALRAADLELYARKPARPSTNDELRSIRDPATVDDLP
ncbi:MAG: GGDEF domain-containing protein [Microthrixaceae bacterium]